MNMTAPLPGELTEYRPPPGEPPADATKSPMMVFSIIRRRKWSILLTVGLLSGLAVVAASRMKPNFVATASVLIQQHNAGAIDLSPSVGMVATDSFGIRTQVDLLRSEDLARGVVREQHLIDLPEFSPHVGLVSRLKARLGIGGAPAAAMPVAQREELATQILLGMTSAVNDGRSYVIDIAAKESAGDAAGAARAAGLSAMIANAYADYYVRFTGTMKSDAIRQANILFDDHMNALKDNTRKTELAVQTYRLQNGLIDADGGSGSVTIIGQQMGQLNTELSVATADRVAKEAAMSQVGAPGGAGSMPEVVASPLVQGLRQQQADVDGRLAALTMSRGSGSAEVMALRAEQRDVAMQIGRATGQVAGSLRTAVVAARAREATLRAQLDVLQKQVGSQGQSEVKLHELQNEADIAQLLYSSYLKRYEETSNQIDMQSPDALVVSRAGVPLGPSPPSKQEVVGAAVVVSFVLAILLALVRERLQGGFRTSAQLEASLGVETLGFIPKVRNPMAALRFADRTSEFSEAIYSTRVLMRLKMRTGAQVVMVTSALPREGKTFFSSALARNAAMAGERVLLIDCDLRRPGVSKNLTTTPLQRVEHVMIRRDEFSSLDVLTLTCGRGSPQDLFASPRMRNLIGKLRERYDLVVLDTPPVLAVSDARVLSALSDATVLVVRWQSTAQHLVNSAVAALQSSGALIAGSVITQVRLRELDSADGADAYFYRSYGGLPEHEDELIESAVEPS